jgi:hypothetical protein
VCHKPPERYTHLHFNSRHEPIRTLYQLASATGVWPALNVGPEGGCLVSLVSHASRDVQTLSTFSFSGKLQFDNIF